MVSGGFIRLAVLARLPASQFAAPCLIYHEQQKPGDLQAGQGRCQAPAAGAPMQPGAISCCAAQRPRQVNARLAQATRQAWQ